MYNKRCHELLLGTTVDEVSCLRRIECSGITESEEYVNACNELCDVLLWSSVGRCKAAVVFHWGQCLEWEVMS